MLCNDCGKNEATIHSINYINGEKSELHVCAECAKNHPELNFGFNSFGFNALEPTDLIKKFFGLGNIMAKSCGYKQVSVKNRI